MRELRGNKIALIVQDALATMNPVTTVGEQIIQVLQDHGVRGSKSELRERAVEVLRQVRLPGAAARLRSYPHELSGGVPQRVAIAAGRSVDAPLVTARDTAA